MELKILTSLTCLEFVYFGQTTSAPPPPLLVLQFITKFGLFYYCVPLIPIPRLLSPRPKTLYLLPLNPPTHPILELPAPVMPFSLWNVRILHGSFSCLLQRYPNHLNFPALTTTIISGS